LCDEWRQWWTSGGSVAPLVTWLLGPQLTTVVDGEVCTTKKVTKLFYGHT